MGLTRVKTNQVDSSATTASSSALNALASITAPGLLKKEGNGWVTDNSTYLTHNQTITVSGDATGAGSTELQITLTKTGVMPGSYTKLSVNEQGRIIAGSSMSSTDVISSLGFTPYNATNPSGYQTSSQVTSAIQAVVGAAPAALDTLQEIAAQLSTDESAVSALTTTVAGKAAKATTLAGYGITDAYTKTQIDTSLAGKQAAGSYLTSITSANVTTALGFTPYNATNPNNYITSSGAPVQSVNGSTGAVTVSPASIGAINTNQLAIASGVATLDAAGKLLTAQRPVLVANDVENALVGTGAVIQTISAVVPASTGTSTVTLANTTPTTAMGTQIWTSTITPNASTSKVRATGSFTFVSGTASRILMAFVFRGTTCIGTFGIASTATATPYNLTIDLIDSPATTAATTYSVRVGVTSAATWYINQFATAYFNGTLALSSIALQELA